MLHIAIRFQLHIYTEYFSLLKILLWVQDLIKAIKSIEIIQREYEETFNYITWQYAKKRKERTKII